MTIKVICLDIQGTLVVPALRNKKTQEIHRSAIDGNNTPAYQLAFSSACFPEVGELPEWEVIPVINGVSEMDTFQKLKALADKGVALYLTSGDGKESTHREPGSMGVVEVRDLLLAHNIPTTIVNWELVRAKGLNPETSVGKNLLLSHAATLSQATNDEVLFIDDAQKLINRANEAGFKAMHVDASRDLTSALVFAIDNSLKIDVAAAASSAAQSTPTVSPPLFTVYNNLPVEFRQFLSVSTQGERHAMKDARGVHPSTEMYWNGLTDAAQKVLKAEFELKNLDVQKTAVPKK